MKKGPRVTSPIDNQRGRTPLRRDTQQWVLDYLIQETGKVFHFQGDERGELPKSVRSHAMISKHMGQEAQRMEAFARVELDAGHPETALGFYFRATYAYGRAQHPIFDLNEEKKFLYAGLHRCYDQVCKLSPYRLEHIDVVSRGMVRRAKLFYLRGLKGKAARIKGAKRQFN